MIGATHFGEELDRDLECAGLHRHGDHHLLGPDIGRLPGGVGGHEGLFQCLGKLVSLLEYLLLVVGVQV